MKSLHKTFDILEYVVLQNGRRVTPSEVAEGVGINIATCTRIMGELLKRGYLEQISRKEGYIAGPMIVSIATRDSLYKQMANAAAEPIYQLSTALTSQVNAAVMQGSTRIMLTYYFRDYYMTMPWKQFHFMDHWQSAAGRLLLSSLDDREAKKICLKDLKLEKYPKEEIETMRKNGFVRFEKDDKIILGHIVRCPGFPALAFGLAVQPEQAEKAFELVKQTAVKISNNLTGSGTAY